MEEVVWRDDYHEVMLQRAMAISGGWEGGGDDGGDGIMGGLFVFVDVFVLGLVLEEGEMQREGVL